MWYKYHIFLFQFSKERMQKLPHIATQKEIHISSLSRKNLLLIATFHFVKLIKIGLEVLHD